MAMPEALTACTRLSGASPSAATYTSQPAVSVPKPISQPRLPSSSPSERNGRRGLSRGSAATASCSFV